MDSKTASKLYREAGKEQTSNPFIKFVLYYQNNRVEFVKRVLGANPDPWQEKVLRALDNGATRISIRSGHGVGKTTMLAWLIIHFIMTRAPMKTAVTAPTTSQLFDGLVPETKIWISRMIARTPALQNILQVKTDRIEWTTAPELSFVTFKTSRKETPEALQGIHATHVLLIADEASGVDDAVYEAAIGSMSTPGAITILAGNPTRRSGFFFKTFDNPNSNWTTFHVPCSESSRVDHKFIKEIEDTYGKDSQAYRIRVLGEFPLADANSFIPFHLVEDASKRDIQPERSQPVYWGVDVARYGDDSSALAKRRGSVLLEPVKIWAQLDTMQLVGAIRAEYDATPVADRPEEIFVDVIGVGAGVADRLRELDLPAVGINVAEAPSVTMDGVRLRDDLWSAGLKWFASRIVKIPFDEKLMAELTTPTVTYTSQGKIKIESKDEMKKRGKQSPNRADAFLLTFARGGAVAAGLTTGKWRKGKPLRRKDRRRV